MKRREFLQNSALAAGVAVVSSLGDNPARAAAKNIANEKIGVAVVGVRGRGAGLLGTFAGIDEVELRYVCDIDEQVLGERTKETNGGRHQAEAITDFRRALDDKSVHAIVLGTPDHWHAIPTILACQAGKDVYVEKPDGHNIVEGRTMVAAAKRHDRIVQLGTQSRSGAHFLAAMELINSGKLGRSVMAKAWESARQGNLGHPPDTNPPTGVDYDTWLGPAPKRPFNPLRFHGNWRWFFDYGTGDLGNDGVHRIDVARWALETAIEAQGEKPLGPPTRVSAIGGKHYHDDAQEWPDNFLVTWEYPGRLLSYEMRLWCPYHIHGDTEGAVLYGDQGYLVFHNSGWRAYTPKNEVFAEMKGGHNDRGHAENFLSCMRTRARPAADLETVGHPSSLLCHIGNAAWRAGRDLRFDFEKYEFTGDAEANQYLTRPEYRQPWTLPKLSDV